MKKQRTEQEKIEHEAKKKEKREFKKLVTRIVKSCRDVGLVPTELQFDFLKSNTTPLPSIFLTKERTIEAYETAISKYKETVQTK